MVTKQATYLDVLRRELTNTNLTMHDHLLSLCSRVKGESKNCSARRGSGESRQVELAPRLGAYHPDKMYPRVIVTKIPSYVHVQSIFSSTIDDLKANPQL